MDVPSGSSNSEPQVRQKRVLPSRSRRGGPGVGSCDVDMMILETQRKKFENEPLIPSDTPFLLTTNPAVASMSSSYKINLHANDRYFERPEVLKAYREQSTIQTPDFVSLGDTPAGRLRARSQAGITEDGPSETSDTAYEKRHRKYETFEKRQRLREKEKLKHEQYKLKERIEQLRAMDGSAFMSLPDNIFPVTDNQPDTDGEESTSGAPINGIFPNREGERRRKGMLDIAYMLEDRYRVLLPPERTTKKVPEQIALESSVEPEYLGREKQLSEPRNRSVIETTRQDAETLKLKIKFPMRPADSYTADSPMYVSTSKNASSKQRRQSLPPARVSPRRSQVTQGDLFSRGASPVLVVDPSVSSTIVLPRPQESTSAPATPMSNPEIAVLGPSSPESEVMQEEHLIYSGSTEGPESAPRSHKRFRRSSTYSPPSSRQVSKEPSVPPIESISGVDRHRSSSHASVIPSSKQRGPYTAKKDRVPRLLMTHAIRSSENRASKTQRHLYAFGSKLQNETFEEAEFKLPDWVFDKTPEPDTSELQIALQPNVRIIATASRFSRQPPEPPNSKENHAGALIA